MRYLIRTKLILLIGISVVLTYLVVIAFDILRVRNESNTKPNCAWPT